MNATISTRTQRPDAVVWIDEQHAIVAQLDPAGEISTVEVRRAQQVEARYVGRVVHELGAHEHIMVLGPEPIRLALERRFVAVGHRPDRLMAPPRAESAGKRVMAGLSELAA